MKSAYACLALVGVICALLWFQSSAQERPAAQAWEYVTIRWAGKENTHIIRPGGQVEFIGVEIRKLVRPDRTDDRSFFMNAAMNGLAREGFEFAGMTPDDIVMKRPVGR